MNVTHYTALLCTVLLAACSTAIPSMQNISNARSAVYAATKKQSELCSLNKTTINEEICNHDSLNRANNYILQAETELNNGETATANEKAQSALAIAQELLRRQHEIQKN